MRWSRARDRPAGTFRPPEVTIQKLAILIPLIFILLPGIGCNGTPGDPADENEAGFDIDESDVGNADAGDVGNADAGGDVGDDFEEDTDGCIPETDEEFCERLDAVCGELVDLDNCDEPRAVECSEFEQFHCGLIGECIPAEEDDSLDQNACECPEVDFEEDGQTICDVLGADCGTVIPENWCIHWEDEDVFDCGNCEDGNPCGLVEPNSCDCPCEIDGGCQMEGEAHEDDPCRVCDTDASTDSYSPAEAGTGCADNAVCDMEAECVCIDGHTDCGAGWLNCIDTTTRLDHCGGCGQICQSDVEGAMPVCDDGNCTVECTDDSLTACKMADECVDLTSNDAHCGECGLSCGPGGSCQNGVCICSGEFESCADTCVDTNSDVDHCGECGSDCPDDISGAEPICENGECTENCLDPEHEICGDICTDVDTDPNHCSDCYVECPNEIQGGEPVCIDGECDEICADPEEEICEEACVDLETDPDHCGMCNQACPSSSIADLIPVCDMGQCSEACDPDADDPTCEQEEIVLEVMAPNVYISFDLSDSMDATDGTGMTRIERALGGLDLIAEELHDEIRFGLGTFPSPPDYASESCDIKHELDIGFYSDTTLKNTWEDYGANGWTPMLASLQDINDNDRLHDPNDPQDDSRLRAILLVTDGWANCSDGDSIQRVTDEIADMYDNQGILTFVIGFELDDQSLEGYAQAGGTDEHIVVTSSDEFESAVDDFHSDIQDLNGPIPNCTLEVDEGPLDSEHLWIEADGELLSSDTYDYDAQQGLIELEDTTCTSLNQDVPDKIVIKMGCESACIQ